MGESQLVPAATAATGATAASGTASCTGLAYLAMHPIGVAVVGGILIGLGAYYLGKSMANRQHKASKEAAAPAAAPAAAAA